MFLNHHCVFFSPLLPQFAAAIARRVYLRQGLGIGQLSRAFGGAKRFGSRPQHHVRSARGHLRKIMIQLEKNGIVSTRVLENAA